MRNDGGLRFVLVIGLLVGAVACAAADDVDEYLTSHAWTVFNLDLIPAPEDFLRISPAPEVGDGQRLLKERLEFRSISEIYLNTENLLSIVGHRFLNDPEVWRYELRENGRAMALFIETGMGTYSVRPTNTAVDEYSDILGPWNTIDGEPRKAYREISDPDRWDFVVEIPDRYPGFWPRGTHLLRWVGDNRLESDGTFGADQFYVEVVQGGSRVEGYRFPAPDYEYVLHVISPVERDPDNPFNANLIMTPVTPRE